MTNNIESIARAAAAAAMDELRHDLPSKGDIEDIISKSVKQTLIQLGVDASNPMEMQRDLQYLRQWRIAGEEIRNKGLSAVVGVILIGICGLIWATLKGP